jgi:hypothetical protein
MTNPPKDIYERITSLAATYAENLKQVKHRVIAEFFDIVNGKKLPSETRSDLSEHALSVQLMSLIYRSGIDRKELVTQYA